MSRRSILSSWATQWVVSCALLLIPVAAAAQTPPAQPAAPVVVRWNNGLSLESADGADKLQLGTLIQFDGRFALTTPRPITDTFLIRRGRFLFQGRTQKYFEFTFVPDFANSSLTLFDAYVDTVFSRSLRVRAGKAKSPIGLEALYSDATLPFAERSVANNLVPNRDLGVRVLGTVARGHLSYVAGIENGVADAASGDLDGNSGKDLVGRLTVASGPFGVAVGASHGRETGALAGFRSTAQQTFFSYASGVAAAGARDRVSPSAFVYSGRYGGFVEYFRTAQEIALGAVTTPITNTGWNATGIVVLTGEPASDRGVTPKASFDPANGKWGALQIAVRAAQLSLDPTVFSTGLAAAGASRTARAFGVGLIWYATPVVKQFLTVERTVFDGDARGPRRAENAVIFRVQINLAPKLD
jgi:phosphate-selective porin OprO/OprP